MDKARKYAPITDNLNRLLQKYLSQFSNNTEWTDINIWVEKVEKAIQDNPSPYISQKIVLSKRLQQGLNPVLPAKTHQSIIRIHQLIFNNMRNSVQGNVNEYIRLFAEDLGVYSVALFPYFSKTQTMAHRYYCLALFNDYYMDLKKQLIPLLPGLLISLLTVYGITNDEDLKARIFDTFQNLKRSTGRKYFIGAVWMTILKHPQCRTPGIHILKSFIPPMKLLPDQDSIESSHGFSDIQGELLAQNLGNQHYERKRTLSNGALKTKISRQSNSLPPRVQKPPLSIKVDSNSQKSPLLPPNSSVPSNTIGQMMSIGQTSNPTYKTSTPKNQPSTLPVTNQISNAPNHFTPIKSELNKQDSPKKVDNKIQIPGNSNNLSNQKPPTSNLPPSFTPPHFNPPSGFKPPPNFQMPSNFTMPPNFTPPPKPPKTPPRTPTGSSKIPQTNLQKQLLQEMQKQQKQKSLLQQNQKQSKIDNSTPISKPNELSSTSIERNIQNHSKQIRLSPSPNSLMTPPTKPIQFKPPTGMTPPPGFKFPPNFVAPPVPGKSINPPKIVQTVSITNTSNSIQNPSNTNNSANLANSQNKIDFSKMPQPPPGFKFDPSKPLPPPPAGFKFPSGQQPPMPQTSSNNKPPQQKVQNVIPPVLAPNQQKPINLPQNNIKPPIVNQPHQNNPNQSIQANKKQSKKQQSLQESRKQSLSVLKSRKPVPPLDKFPYVPTSELQQLNKINDEDLDMNNYPNKNSLVLNSIVSCLTDQSSLVKRYMLDFMCSHLRVKNKVFQNQDKKVIVEAALLLFVKKQLTITKRVNNWLFGKPDEQQNKYFITQKNEVIIPFIIQGFQNMLSKQPKSSILATQPLKVLQNFYMQHQHFVSKTLSPIVLPTIRYIFNFGYGKDYSEEIMKAGQRFFQNIPSFYNVILISLGDQLLKAIQSKDDLRCFEVVKYLDFCYIKLMKHQAGPEELEYISNLLYNLARTLDYLSFKEPDLSQYTFIKHLMLLIVNLIDRKDKIDFDTGAKRTKQNLHILDQSHLIELPKQRIQYQKQLKQQQEDRQILFRSVSQSLEKFYVKVGQTIRMCQNLLPYEQTYKLGSLAITKVQRSLPREEVKILPSWFDAIEVGIKLTNPVISLAAIEAMIFCLTSQAIHPAYNSFKRLIIAQKNKRIGSDYQRQALQKLWSLLDFPHMHKKIIDLIVNFSKYFPYQFTQVVSKSFQTYNVPDKQASIQRFSHFWRLTGKKYKDLLQNNHQLTQLNKVGLFVMLDFLEDDNPLVRHAAKNWLLESMSLFSRVLQPLFSELMQIKDNVFVTPQGQNIISKKYDTKKVFGIFRRIKSILTNGASSFLSYIYQTQLTDQLEELRASFTDISFPIITKQKVQKVQAPVAVETKQPVLPKAIRQEQEKNTEQKNNITADKLTYMDLLIIISIKYIKGQAIQSMGIDFHVGNSSVNAASIEFLQTFLGYIDDSKLCERFINFILGDLFHVLQQGVGNQQYIIQVQLLNLFKTIFFNSSFRLKGNVQNIRKMFSNIYTNSVFSNSLLKGLNTPFSYVRTQFISFISISIPLIADFLEPEQCTTVIKSILYTYYQIIKGVNMRLVKDQPKEEQRLQEPPANLKRIIEIRQRNMKEDRVVKLTDNLSQVAKTNEILAILHGVSVILNYFFELDKLDFKKIQFQFTDPYTVFDTFKSIITLGFASTQKQQKLISKPIFLHNLQTCESILRDMGPVFETILRAWPLSEQYVKIATNQFSQIGMKTFGFERFSKYNSVLKSLIEYVSTQKQSIWGKIISIMKPMFFKFPKQIVSIYIELWIRQCPSMDAQGNYELSSARCEFLMKIIETLIVNDFPLNILVAAYVESPIVQRVRNHHLAKVKDVKKGNVLEYQMAVLESKLIFFIHVIFHYLHLTNQVIQRDNLLIHWKLVIKVIKPFLLSKNPNTCMWILEFLNLCAKKYSPKQILSFQKFKTQFHLIINDKLKFIAGVGSKTMNFFYEEPAVDMRDQENAPKQNNSYRLILPYTPAIYQLLKEYKDPNRTKASEDISWELFTPIKAGNNQAIERRNRFFAFKTLKRIGLQLIQNTYMPQKNHWIVTRTKQWIDEILPVVQDKSPQNMVFAQAASQVLHDLLDKARSMFLRVLKPDLLKIFNKDDFFICNIPTLKYWSKIIDWVVNFDKNNQTFSYYLQKVALSTSYFSSGDNETKKRVKSFQRICFILYSGCKDRYSLKIKGLLQKISQILKTSQSAHPSLLILILFAIRILILRLSQITLNQLFIDIWPMIMTLLIQLFSRKLVKVELANQISKHPNLLLAGLKLIEMASVVNLVQFSHHQWIFLYDYFGIKLSIPSNNVQMTEYLNLHPEYRQIFSNQKSNTSSPFIFQPSLANYFPPSNVDYIPKPYPHQLSIKPLKRQLIIKQAQIQDESELRIRAIILCQYLINLNELRYEVLEQDIQMLLVDDFIQLDNFIHKM